MDWGLKRFAAVPSQNLQQDELVAELHWAQCTCKTVLGPVSSGLSLTEESRLGRQDKHSYQDHCACSATAFVLRHGWQLLLLASGRAAGEVSLRL
jgi:hypothetical protein